MTKEEFISQVKILQVYPELEESYKLKLEKATEAEWNGYLEDLNMAEKDLIESKRDFFREVSSIEQESIREIETEKKRLRAEAKVLLKKDEEQQAEKVLIKLDYV